jgi:hypothetical protein
MDCTLIGAPPPTGTEPTMIWRLWRRGARGGGGTAGIPRLTAVTSHHLEKIVIGLTTSAVIVSSVNAPPMRITA